MGLEFVCMPYSKHQKFIFSWRILRKTRKHGIFYQLIVILDCSGYFAANKRVLLYTQ